VTIAPAPRDSGTPTAFNQIARSWFVLDRKGAVPRSGPEGDVCVSVCPLLLFYRGVALTRRGAGGLESRSFRPGQKQQKRKSIMRYALCAVVLLVSSKALAQQAGDYVKQGDEFKNKTDYDQAIAAYNEALRLEPNNAAAYRGRGTSWTFKREYDKALADHDEAIRLEPSNSYGYQDRALTWKSQGKHDRAIADYTESIRLNPRTAVPYTSRAKSWQAQGNFDNAIADYSEAIRLEPQDKFYYGNRAQALIAKGDAEGAIADYDRQIELDPRYSFAYSGRARAWQSRGDYDRALADLAEAIRFDPAPYNYYSRSRVWTLKGEHDRAIADCSEGIRLDQPSSTNGYLARGDARRAQGGYEQAIADFNEALRINPKSAGGFNGRAWIYATCPKADYRNAKKSVEDATQACESTTWKNALALQTLAAAYAESGNFTEAIKWLKQAMEMTPKENVKQRLEMLTLFESGRAYREPDPG
jgi:tetratricopeptide (TPR) repeat protein